MEKNEAKYVFDKKLEDYLDYIYGYLFDKIKEASDIKREESINKLNRCFFNTKTNKYNVRDIAKKIGLKDINKLKHIELKFDVLKNKLYFIDGNLKTKIEVIE